MRYIIFQGGNGYSGCSYTDGNIYEDNISDAKLDAISWDICVGYAQGYEYMIEENLDENEDLDEVLEDYYMNIYHNWKEVSKEEYQNILFGD